MLVRLETTTGDNVWINPHHIVNVCGDEDCVKITTTLRHQWSWVFRGTVSYVVQILNGEA